MTNKKIKCYCNICKRRRELGLEPAHKIVVDKDGIETVVYPKRHWWMFRRRRRRGH